MINVFRNIIILFLVAIFSNVFPQFTTGDLVILQVGNGTSALVNTGNQILLREFNPLGMPAFSVAVSTSVNPLIIGGTAISEGGLSLTPNGKYLVFAGYASNLTFTTSLSGASASALNRGIGIVGAAGNYSRIATSPTFYSGNSIRGATSDGNDNYWAGGANAGANYFGLNSPAATIQTSITNTRNVIAFNGNIYFSTGSGTPGIYRVGSGFPVSSGQTCSLVINTAGSTTNSPSPFAFFFNQGQTICYVADDRTPVNNGGIQKWIYSMNTWTLAYTLSTGASYSARGVIADFSGANPKIYATTSEGSSNRLITINDLGSGSTATNLATASANTIFRGLAFSPYCSVPQTGIISTNGTVCANQVFTLSTNVSGTAPITYTWSGPGSFSSSAQSPTLGTSISGNYSLTINNGCGSDATSTLVTVNQMPLVIVNASTICSGGTAILNAGGAFTYNWSNAATGNSIAVSPTVTTNYSVIGTSQSGCSAIAGSSVIVVDTLTLFVNSEVACRGDTVILAASGAMGYTWNTNSISFSISVNPSITTIYTVTGSAPGCPNPASATSTVVINQPPVVSIEPFNSFFCVDDSTFALNGNPQGGTYTGTGISSSIFTPAYAGIGNYLLTYSYTDTNSCCASDSVMVSVSSCTAINKIRNSKERIIYPNPAGDIINLDLNEFPDEIRIEIFNGVGQKLKELNTSEMHRTIDIRNYSQGIYFLI